MSVTLLHVNGLSRAKGAARLVGRLASDHGGRVILAATGRGAIRDLDAVARELGLPPERIESVAQAGNPGQVLAQLARDRQVDLTVVPPMGLLDDLTGRRMSYGLARKVGSDVLLLRGEGWPVRSMLVCTEGERRGVATFERAAKLAKSLDARLHVLHVLSQMALVGGSREPTQEEFLASDDPVAAHLLDLRGRLRTYALHGGIEVRRGLVDDEIAHAARDHDLLVIGAHDAQADGALLEDIAADLVRAAPCSVLLARSGVTRKDAPAQAQTA